LEIGCEFRSSQHTALRLLLWGDRWIWADARSLTKGDGWTWHFTHEGRAVGGLTGRQIAEALEASLAASSPVHSNQAEMLEQVWRPILVPGPPAANWALTPPAAVLTQPQTTEIFLALQGARRLRRPAKHEFPGGMCSAIEELLVDHWERLNFQ
jgi:hypothetical protein